MALNGAHPDPGVEPLDRLLGGPLEVGSFLRLAIGITRAVGEVHGRDLVHKDIKPANILVNGATGAVQLTGFGIASRLPRERQSPKPPETIAGTLAYMAPEQTGRMNRSIDSRSDLYSLGITLYQMLTGSLPFTASDPMEWVHCHIARKPVPPAERLPNTPAVLSAIVMKLLAKTAEERYQTAAGLESDLLRCLTQWEAQRRIDDFPLGEHDTPDWLLVPEKLYGRQREVETLLACFNRIVTGGAPELALVCGHSGIGKSSVVNELHKALVARRGFFAAGKFDQYKRDIPYLTLAQAFQGLLRDLLAKNEADLAAWREALHEALGENGRLMIDLVPELKLIIGEQPPVAELPPQQAQGRFQLLFRRFIGVFARPQHPLTLFLDDLQWSDVATLDLLENLLSQPGEEHLLVIGAYRDNEVDSTHPLTRKLDTMRKAGASVQEIRLAPLAPEIVQQLIADTLHCEPAHSAPLAQLVHEKTAGNPFFLIQFLRAITEEGLLTFEHDRAHWRWDLDRIRAKGYTDNVADLLVGKLKHLPVEAQNALRQFACLGASADVTTLSLVLQTPVEQVHADLWEAVSQEFLERSAGAYRFIHDSVQEAAYSLIPEDRRAEAHLRIGRLLVAHTPPEKRVESIFELVSQLNSGSGLIASQAEREQLAELNLTAGRRAKSSAAYPSALKYLTSGAALLTEDRWERRHELAFALELHRADCELWTGALPSAEQSLAVLATRAADAVQRAAVASRRVDLYTMLGASDRAVAVGLECLRHAGIDWPTHPNELDARREYEQIWSQLGDGAIEDLIALPLMEDPESLATLDVLTALGPPALFTDGNLYVLTSCRAVNLSLQHGNSDATPAHYAAVGLMAGDPFGDCEAGYRLGKMACDLTERRGLKRFGGKTYSLFSLITPWTRPVREGIDPARRGFQMANEQGDATFAAYACSNLTSILLAAGDPLEQVERDAEHGLKFARTLRFGLVADMISASLALARTLRGETRQFGVLDAGPFTERSFEERLTGHPALALPECFYWIRKLQARFFACDYASAVEAAESAERWLSSAASLSVHLLERAEYHLYAALSRAARCEPSGPDAYAKHREALAAHHRQLQAWAANCPENFEDRAALVGAEIARIEGRLLEAMDLYERAIGSARANGLVQNEAIAHELAARFYEKRGFEDFARVYLRKARDGYVCWGADGKARQLDELYPHLGTKEPLPAPISTIQGPVESLDLATVIKVSQIVSGEIVLEKLLETLMRAAIEHSGADRGALIAPRGDEFHIEAEATTSGEDVTVHLRDSALATTALPESLVRYVVRTETSVILDDASSQSPFSADPYIVQRHARSILCLPLVNRGKLIGVLYLENSLAPRAFAPARVEVLQVLASQAAMSLENSRLYRDLAQREARIRRLVDANIFGIFIWDLDGTILDANDAFLRALGYEREDLLAGHLRWADLTVTQWGGRDRQELLAEIQRTGSLQPFEWEHIRKDGSRMPVMVGAASFEGGNQGVAFVLDLTERKRAQEALQKSEAYLAEGQRLSHTGSWSWSPDTDVRYWSEECFRILGFDPREGLPRTEQLIQRIHPDDQAVFRESINRAKQEKLDEAVDYRIVHPGGAIRDIHSIGHPVFSPAGDLIEFMGTVIDITERKRAEEALRTSEAYLAEAQRLSHTGSWAWSPDHDIRYWSEECYRVLSFDPQDGLPRFEDFLQRIHPDDQPGFREIMATALREKAEWETDYRIVHPGGLVRDIHVVGRPVLSASGHLVEFVGTVIDVTERRRAEKERARLQQLDADLAHANRLSMMGVLTASLAHEVKQPIAAARNNARAALNFLARNPPDLGEVTEALGCIVDDADRAGAIVDRIRAHTKKAPPRKDRFDLNEAVTEVVELARSEIARHGVSVQTRLAQTVAPVQGDRVQLQQVILNLVLNAIEAMSSVDGRRELLVSTQQRQTSGVVTVCDSGPGIAPDKRERVFEAFYTTKSNGVGIGLSICRSIIDAHGGRLWVEANEPRGAAFQFTVPSAANELRSPSQSPDQTREPYERTVPGPAHQRASVDNTRPPHLARVPRRQRRSRTS